MSNLIDIARSAVMTFRAALDVTSENIANVNTEGYRRRDLTTAEIGGAQPTLTTFATTVQGVQVDQVRRAFDAILAERLRSANGDVGAATTHLAATQSVESLFLPASGGIDTALDGFFTALGGLSSAPADTALRRVVIQNGTTLAGAFSDIAAGLTRLRADTVTEAGLVAAQVTDDLAALFHLQETFTATPSAMGALNPSYDQRDQLLSHLSGLIGISVTLDPAGRAEVSLGTAGGGPILLDRSGAAQLSVDGNTDLTLSITRNGTTRDTRMFSSGALGGYARALGGIDDALAELDALARKVAGDMNAVHRGALDLTGAPGGDLFALDGWAVTPALTNQGRVQVQITQTGPATTGPLTLIHDGATGLWRAEDAGGTVLATGAAQLVLPGVTIALEGTPATGDRLSLQPTDGRAVNMRFLLTQPEQIAAAAASLVAPAPGNLGSATVQMVPVSQPPPALPDLTTLLPGPSNAATAVSLLGPGVVGYIPAGAGSADLASLGAQSGLDFALADAQLPGLTTLQFTIGGTPHSVDLTPITGPTATMADIAAALNDGTLLTTSGDSFATLGIAAAGVGGSLSLSLANGDFIAGSVTSAGTPAAGVTSAAAPQGGTIQIFTREGRQIAGPPLSAADAALLLTPANGFVDGAEYDATAVAGPPYRGMAVDQTQLPGPQALTLAPNPPATWSGATPAPAAPAQSLLFEGAGAPPVTVTLPTGGTATTLATALAAAIPGLTATAQTAVEVTAPADGLLSFQLAGDNLTPLQISANVTLGRLDAVALAVNAQTTATGITAQISPMGDRLILRHAGGQDIRITGLTHSTGDPVSLRAVDATGQPISADITLGAGQDGARISGQITLHQDAVFSTTLAATRLDSALDPLAGGLITRSVADAGASQTFAFRFDPALDAVTAAADGLSATASATRYSLSVAGRDVTLDTATTATPDAAAVATGLATLLRETMPEAGLTGAAVATLPAEGASTAVTVDGQSYTLRMTGGAVAVTGPEPGRLNAVFGPDNRLRLTVQGGVTDAATITLPGGMTGATAFGLSPLQSPTTSLTGQPATPSGLPSTLRVQIGTVSHDLTITSGPTVSLPPGFPGTASVDGLGRITLTAPASVGQMRIAPDLGALAAGFDSLGATLSVAGDSLTLTASDGAALSTTAGATALAGQRLHLTGLPDEDLIVVMSGTGALRLAGAVTAGTPSPTPAPTELRVLDAAAGRVALIDLTTGQSIATRTLDATGSATLGGVQLTLTGTAATGDAFRLMPNQSGRNDGRALDALLALRRVNPATGQGGFADILADRQADIGAAAAAAARKVTSTGATQETLQRADAEKGAVDLDREAARLLELQQDYQAAAQIITVARDLFDTLLRSL
jgi:flagellar hook-associated protein 1